MRRPLTSICVNVRAAIYDSDQSVDMRVDLTRLAQFKAPANLVTVSPRGLVRPKADGAGALEFSVLGKSGRLSGRYTRPYPACSSAA